MVTDFICTENGPFKACSRIIGDVAEVRLVDAATTDSFGMIFDIADFLPKGYVIDKTKMQSRAVVGNTLKIKKGLWAYSYEVPVKKGKRK